MNGDVILIVGGIGILAVICIAAWLSTDGRLARLRQWQLDRRDPYAPAHALRDDDPDWPARLRDEPTIPVKQTVSQPPPDLFGEPVVHHDDQPTAFQSQFAAILARNRPAGDPPPRVLGEFRAEMAEPAPVTRPWGKHGKPLTGTIGKPDVMPQRPFGLLEAITFLALVQAERDRRLYPHLADSPYREPVGTLTAICADPDGDA